MEGSPRAGAGDLAGRRTNPRRGRATGGDWILNVPPYPISLWGDGTRCAAAQEEGTLLVGPVGAGKTTIAQRYVRARLGLDGGEVLGMRVSRAVGPILYLAMDRPAQIARSFRRMTEEDDRRALNEMLHVWQGLLPPEAIPRTPGTAFGLRRWIRKEFGDVCEVIVDSYKDLGYKLTDDEQATTLNLVMQECITDGIDWFGLHHHRKSNGENKRPDRLDDVYGSRWITAGVGSVLCLWGEAGGDVSTLTHLKQPAEPVGPLTVMHDRPAGAAWAVALGEASGSRDTQKERRARILHYVHASEAGSLSPAEIADVLGVPADSGTLKGDLRALVKELLLAREGAGRGTRYRSIYLEERMRLSESA